jgi:hypothetical protein
MTLVNAETGEVVKDRPEPKEFAAVLVEHLNGRTHHELSDDLHALIEAVMTHGKKGSLSISLVVEPTSAAEGSPIAIAFESTLKAPKATAPRAIFFVDNDGNPVRENPSQIGFDFRTAPAQPTTLKDA